MVGEMYNTSNLSWNITFKRRLRGWEDDELNEGLSSISLQPNVGDSSTENCSNVAIDDWVFFSYDIAVPYMVKSDMVKSCFFCYVGSSCWVVLLEDHEDIDVIILLTIMTMLDSDYMMENGASGIPLAPEEEKRIVEELSKQAESNLKEGNLYYVVSNR
ncbi:hypothetical protein C3L33_16187, partial [Rhododendron williamsianum]